MTYKIAMVAQKGGVGKSTLARIIAVEATKGGLQTKIADLDTQQTTSVNWAARRAANGWEPPIRAEAFRLVDTALQDAENFDLYIFDGAHIRLWKLKRPAVSLTWSSFPQAKA